MPEAYARTPLLFLLFRFLPVFLPWRMTGVFGKERKNRDSLLYAFGSPFSIAGGLPLFGLKPIGDGLKLQQRGPSRLLDLP